MPGKIKKCRCGNEFEQFNTLQNKCVPCLIAAGKKKIEKDFRKETRRRKKELLTKREWIKKIQPDFNKMIRVRDRDQPCISCGRSNEEVEKTEGWRPGGAWDCGHYLSIGSHPELRFTETNAHKQCKTCNAGSGQYTRKSHTVSQEYRERLIERIGIEEVERLEGPHEMPKWTVEELEEMGKQFRARTREMEKE